ncbi:MAG TPA: hypothetical protein VE177_00685 [Candidatus Binatus sp.]|nr:hypothetical protein [Candidatus Binatus sp.]
MDIVAKSEVVRLMELFNVEVESASQTMIRGRFHSQDYLKARELKSPLVQWLPLDQNFPTTVVMPDATRTTGLVEESIIAEPVGAIIQMVRVGFGRIDSKDPEIVVYYAHR